MPGWCSLHQQSPCPSRIEGSWDDCGGTGASISVGSSTPSSGLRGPLYWLAAAMPKDSTIYLGTVHLRTLAGQPHRFVFATARGTLIHLGGLVNSVG